MPHRRPLLTIRIGDWTRQLATPGYISGALRHADRPSGIEQIEEVRRLDTEFVCRKRQPLVTIRQQPLAFSLERLKCGHEQRHVSLFKIIGRELDFSFVVDIAICDGIIPGEVEDVVHLLQIHRDTFSPIGDFNGNRIQLDPADFLEVGELGDLHPVEANLPAQAPSTERGGLPVVLNVSDIVLLRVNPQLSQTLQIQRLNVVWRWLQHDLILIVVLHAIWIFTVSPICGTPAWLGIGRAPRLRAKGSEERGRMKRAGPHLQIISLMNDTALVGPVMIQRENEILEGHEQSSRGYGGQNSRPSRMLSKSPFSPSQSRLAGARPFPCSVLASFRSSTYQKTPGVQKGEGDFPFV